MEWFDCNSVEELTKLGEFKEVKKVIEQEIGCDIKVKARGWKQLKEFIDAFRKTVEKFSGKKNNNTIFTSKAAEYIYILTQLNGKVRQEKLRITPIHYKNKEIADKWRKNIAKVIHPDVCKNNLANEAMAKLNLLYREMVD